MREHTLRRYFIGEIEAPELAKELVGATIVVDPKLTHYVFEEMDGDFEVTADHLLRLCADVQARKIPFDELQSVAFCLIASDHFHYNNKRINEVLGHWDTPSINFPFSSENLLSWKRALEGHNDIDFKTADGRSIRLFTETDRGHKL